MIEPIHRTWLQGLSTSFVLVAIALTGCGAALDADGNPQDDTIGESGQAALSCGKPPPPVVCYKTKCLTADLSWEYEALPAGTTCNGTGHCDGDGTCVPAPPAQASITLPIDDNVLFLVRALVSGSLVSVDTSGNGPTLITGSHPECYDPPGPGDEICRIVNESTNAFVKFSDTLKAVYQLRTNQTLGDLALPNMGAVCAGPYLLETCATINQVHADLGNLNLVLGGSGAQPTLRLTLPVESAHPTIFLDAPYPNVDFTDMKAAFTVGLGVSSSKLAVTFVNGTFTYDRNLTHFPDWLVSPFYDVDAKIHHELDERVTHMLSDPARREMLAAALTKALDQFARQTRASFTGFREFLAVRVTNGGLQIDYVPN